MLAVALAEVRLPIASTASRRRIAPNGEPPAGSSLPGGAAAAGLFTHRQRQTSAGPRPTEQHLRVSARPQFQDILRAAPPGSIDPTVDPDDVFDMLLGAVLTRTLLYTATARARPAERTVEMIMRLLRPVERGSAD